MIFPKLCMVIEVIVPVLKGANHFLIQFIVFVLGGKMLIFGY